MRDRRKALIVVDVQKDFCQGGALHVSDADSIVEPINLHIYDNNYDLVVATMDYHPERHVSFYTTHEGKNQFDVIDVHGNEQILCCVQRTLVPSGTR